MANTFITPSIVAREALMILMNNLVGAQLVHRDHTSEFTGAKVGDTISIRAPATFTVDEFTTGPISVQDATETSVSLVLEKHFDVSFEVTSKERTLELDDFANRLIVPAVTALAERVDSYLYEKYIETYYYAGTAGDPPDSIADMADLRRVMNEAKIPMNVRNAIMNPVGEADLLSIEAVHSAEKRGDDGTALREASLGRVMGTDWYMAQAIPDHTAGTAAAAAGPWLTNGAAALGDTTLDIDGGAASETLVVGDLLTIAGSGQHRVTAANTASTGAFTAVAIDPPLRAAVADNSAVTFIDDHAANLAFHRNAFALCAVPLELPGGAARAAYTNFQGLGIRVVEDYDIQLKKDVMSLDILVGAKCIDPRLAVRVLG